MQTSTARGLSATDDDEAKKFQRRQPDLPEEDDDVESRRKGVEGRRSTDRRQRDRQTEGACDKTIRRRSLVGRKEWQMRSGHYDDDEREERERQKYNVFVRMIQGLSKSGGAVHGEQFGK